jgi:hypothetical protein
VRSAPGPAGGPRGPLRLRHPAQAVVVAFAVGAAVTTALLALPVATESGESAGLLTALFTAVSAICVTGWRSSTPRPTGRASARG